MSRHAHQPAWPTTKPRRRKTTTPKMVDVHGANTLISESCTSGVRPEPIWSEKLCSSICWMSPLLPTEPRRCAIALDIARRLGPRRNTTEPEPSMWPCAVSARVAPCSSSFARSSSLAPARTVRP
eukprot:6965778-Prymnesium_polylepis.2